MQWCREACPTPSGSPRSQCWLRLGRGSRQPARLNIQPLLSFKELYCVFLPVVCPWRWWAIRWRRRWCLPPGCRTGTHKTPPQLCRAQGADQTRRWNMDIFILHFLQMTVVFFHFFTMKVLWVRSCRVFTSIFLLGIMEGEKILGQDTGNPISHSVPLSQDQPFDQAGSAIWRQFIRLEGARQPRLAVGRNLMCKHFLRAAIAPVPN